MTTPERSRQGFAVARLRYLGYLAHRDIAWSCLVAFVGVAGVFATLPLAAATLARVGLLTVGAGWLGLLGLYLSVDGTIVVRPRGGWYVAEDARADIARHGRSVDEAVANLARKLESAGNA